MNSIRTGSNRLSRTVLLFSILLFAVYLYPIASYNAYVPYYCIGAAFLFVFANNGFKIKTQYSFFIFTLYALFSNFFIYSLTYNVLSFETIKSSLFLIVPFLSIQIGKIIKGITLEELQKSFFILICIEFIVAIIQMFGGSVGLYLTQIYGGEKYSILYTISGSLTRCIGTFGNPNSLGIGMLVFSVIVLVNNKSKIMIISTLIMVSFMILASKSRLSFVAELIVLTLIYGRFFDSQMRISRKIRNLCFLVVSIFILYRLYTSFVGRDISMSSMESRFVIWKNTISYLNQEDILSRILNSLFGYSITFLKKLEATDNEYLFIFLATGIIGSSIWLVSFFQVIYKSLLLHDDRRITAMCIICIWLLAGLTSSFYSDYLCSFISFFYLGYADRQDSASKGITLQGQKKNEKNTFCEHEQ